MSENRLTVESDGPRIESFLRRVLDRAGLQVTFTIGPGESPCPQIEKPEILVRFAGRDLEHLLTNKAEPLLALEFLTMESLKLPSDAHSQLLFDANDQRLMRMEELRLSALAAAERVKKSQLPFHFSPMTSRERRFLHLALRDETEVRSESIGFGPQRAVVVYPAGMKSLSEPPKPTFSRRR